MIILRNNHNISLAEVVVICWTRLVVRLHAFCPNIWVRILPQFFLMNLKKENKLKGGGCLYPFQQYFPEKSCKLNISLATQWQPNFFNRAIPSLFLFIFRLFKQTNNTIFTKHQCEKCPHSFRCWDFNPWPLELKSSPKTTWSGLPPQQPK